MDKKKSFKVSLVVPIYNVEEYLARCLDSIASQSLSDIEVILVDDGSTDSSLEICNSYAAHRKNWTVITKINEGQGVARNVGIRMASGKYIAFVDADDWIEPDMCLESSSILDSTNADFINFGLDFFNERDQVVKKFNHFSRSESRGNEIFELALLDDEIFSSPCNKIYKRALLLTHEIFFPPLRANEDIYFSRAVSQAATYCVFTPRIFYHALVRPGSTSRGMSRDIYLSTERLLDLEKSRFRIDNPITQQIFNAHIVKLWAYLIIQGSFRIKEASEFYYCLSIATRGNFLLHAKDRLATRHLSRKNRLMAYLCQHPKSLRKLSNLATAIGLQPY